MQFRDLRRALQSIVFATLPTACVGSVLDTGTSTNDCSSRTVVKELSFETPSDPPMDLRVESCRLDADACRALCDMVMQRAGLQTPATCAVQFQGSTVQATTSYSEIIDSGKCHASEGRRPAGLVTPRCIEASTKAGLWLAEAAWLEAASIPAFIYLARELDMHGAPRGLARLALAAARDEIRHAHMMNALALRFGGKPPIADVALPKERSLEAMAIENAIEGCVRETWGAIVAMWQAQRAPDAELRATFAAISRDEARHAALAWAVDSWIQARLDAAARQRVIDARHQAVRELFEGPDAEVHDVLGLPMGADARMLAQRTERTLWQGGLS